MGGTSVTGKGLGSAVPNFPFKSISDLTRVLTSDGQRIFNVENGRVIFRDNLLSSTLDITTVAFEDSTLEDNKLLHSIDRSFVAGITLYDNENEVFLPDSIKIIDNSIEIDLSSFVPLEGVWRMVYIS